MATPLLQTSSTRYKGSCCCGAVQFECGSPIRAPVCHCHGCQSLHGAPFVWSVVLRKEEFRWICGENNLDRYQDLRYTCHRCHGKVVDEGDKYFYSFPAVFGFATRKEIPDSFQPTHHCFYNQRAMDIPDDKPKFVAKWGSARCD